MAYTIPKFYFFFFGIKGSCWKEEKKFQNLHTYHTYAHIHVRTDGKKKKYPATNFLVRSSWVGYNIAQANYSYR